MGKSDMRGSALIIQFVISLEFFSFIEPVVTSLFSLRR
jgi:hypothetical protein